MDLENFSVLKEKMAIDYLTKCKNDSTLTKEHFDLINEILEEYENINEKKDDTDMSKTFTIMDNDSYSRPWNRINEIYRMNKIREYVDELCDEKKINKKNKNDTMKILTEMIKDGQLKSCKEVEYDSKKMKINNIICVEVKGDHIQVKKKKVKKSK